MDNEWLFFISTLGWFNGIILSIYFLFFYKNRKLSGIMFGLMLLALSIRVAKSVLWWFIPDLPLLVIQVGLAGFLFVGPLLNYFITSSTLGIKETPLRWKITLSSYLLVSFLLLIFLSARTDIPIWRNYIIPAIYLHTFVYIIICGVKLKNLFEIFFDKQQQLKPNEKWVLTVYLGCLIVTTFYSLSFFFNKVSYISGPVSFTILLYMNVLILLYRKKTNDLFQSEPEKYASKKIDSEQATAKIQELEQLMKEQQVFTNPELKLSNLAAMLQISGHQLSQLLNDNLGKSFTSYINDWRIKRACEIMTTDTNLKLEAVGYEVGFNSKSTFFAAFKKYTGTTPKQYKEKRT